MANRTYTEELKREYTDLLNSCEIKESWKERINRRARRILANKDRYQKISKLTNGIPWYFIGVIHDMECGLDFSKHLHNGDSLQHRTHQVPAGRPIDGEPPFTFEESAVDALKQKGFDKETDWSMPHMCFMFEKYNGWGYRGKVNSPYLWSGTNHYTRGKYVADHIYNENAVSEQIGTIPLVLALKEVDVPEQTLIDNSRKLTIIDRFKKAVLSICATVYGADWMGYLGQIKAFATDNAGILLIGGALGIWLLFEIITRMSVEDYKNGNYTPSGLTEKDKE